jgi:hypothetical protein
MQKDYVEGKNIGRSGKERADSLLFTADCCIKHSPVDRKRYQRLE